MKERFIKAGEYDASRKFRHSFLAQRLKVATFSLSGAVGISVGFLYIVAPSHLQLLVKKTTGIDLKL